MTPHNDLPPTVFLDYAASPVRPYHDDTLHITSHWNVRVKDDWENLVRGPCTAVALVVVPVIVTGLFLTSLLSLSAGVGGAGLGVLSFLLMSAISVAYYTLARFIDSTKRRHYFLAVSIGVFYALVTLVAIKAIAISEDNERLAAHDGSYEEHRRALALELEKEAREREQRERKKSY